MVNSIVLVPFYNSYSCKKSGSVQSLTNVDQKFPSPFGVCKMNTSPSMLTNIRGPSQLRVDNLCTRSLNPVARRLSSSIESVLRGRSVLLRAKVIYLFACSFQLSAISFSIARAT